MEVNGSQQRFGFSEFFKISYFMFKKETYTGLLNYVNDDIFILGGTIPLSQQKSIWLSVFLIIISFL